MNDLSWPAARYLGRGAVRGHLELTETHVKFRPAGLASRVQGTAFSIQLKHVATAGVAEGTGGLLRRKRDRLCITLGDASEQYFDVSRADEVASAIRERLTATPS